MKKTKFYSALCIAAMVLLAAVGLCGCSASASETTTTDLAVVTLNGSNMPVVSEDLLSDLVESAASVDGNQVSVVVADGTPHLVGDTIRYAERSSKNEAHWKKELSTRCAQTTRLITEARASSAETDLIRGIDLAARQLKAGSGQYKTIMAIIHSGLNTTDPLPMQNYDLTETDTDSLVQQLSEQGYISDLNGVIVHWFYITDVAGSQPELSATQKTAVKQFWDKYLRACGAQEVVFHTDVPVETAAEGAPYVSVVETKKDSVVISPVSLDSNAVAFQPDSFELVDATQAEKQLRALAETMKASGSIYILAGSTADTDYSTLSSSQSFGLGRAKTIASTLEKLGVSASQLECVGIGTASTSVRSSSDEQANRTVWLVDANTQLAEEFLTLGCVD
jgi:outer membrane protein OmpA-like peptidoglycan-associated protein